MKTISLLIIFILFNACTQRIPLATDMELGEFGAFYTKINSGEEFEKYARTGPYADIVVDLGGRNGTVIFWRGTSYLPYLETQKGKRIPFDEIVPREGDGNAVMPDRTNHYSVVKIIENADDKVVVHWRYLPEFKGGNPHTGVQAVNFCEEYFTFLPNGQVIRTIRKGEEKIDDWKDPANQITQTFQITRNGFKNIKEFPASKTFVAQAIEGESVIPNSVVDPALWFRFDEAKGDLTAESKSGTEMLIHGSKTQWKKGVSGTAVQFDGHKNYVSFPAEKGPEIKEAITLEAWVAMAAYPWSWTTIVQQMDDVPEEREFHIDPNTELKWNERFKVIYKKENDTGYFLGINALGQAGFKLRVNGNWEELTSETVLKKDVLYHITASYGKDKGKMQLYLDGKLDCEKQIAKADIETSVKDIFIARGKERAQYAPVRKNTFPAPYTFDGIIDEVKIYTVALSADDIISSYKSYNINPGTFADMEVRAIPAGERKMEFGAYYDFLKFYDSWENLWRTGKHADVIVEFEANPSKFIFWRGLSYIEMMANELNQFYSNEFNETWNTSGGTGCQEPMSDKGVYASHTRIIENTPARVVLEWRFALHDAYYYLANYVEETGWGDWASWYYYIYPDGVAVKTQQLWSSGHLNHEWQESMAIMGPNQHPHDIIARKNTLSYIGLDGHLTTFDWQNEPPDSENVNEAAQGKNIQVVNYTGEYDPVTIVQENLAVDVYNGELTDYAVFCTWNHWPVAQQPSDGRYALYPDRTSHSSLTHIYYPVFEHCTKDESQTPYEKKIMMQGMLNLGADDLTTLARSWINPPALENAIGCSGTYDKTQRAYLIHPTESQISFTLECSDTNPLFNAALVMKNWDRYADVNVWIDNTTAEVKQGIIRDVDGTYSLNIWIEKKSTEAIHVEIMKNEF